MTDQVLKSLIKIKPGRKSNIAMIKKNYLNEADVDVVLAAPSSLLRNLEKLCERAIVHPPGRPRSPALMHGISPSPKECEGGLFGLARQYGADTQFHSACTCTKHL